MAKLVKSWVRKSRFVRRGRAKRFPEVLEWIRRVFETVSKHFEKNFDMKIILNSKDGALKMANLGSHDDEPESL